MSFSQKGSWILQVLIVGASDWDPASASECRSKDALFSWLEPSYFLLDSSASPVSVSHDTFLCS